MTAATGTGGRKIAVSGTGGTTIVATGKDARQTGVSATANGGNGPRIAANGSAIMNAGRTGGGRSAMTIAGIAATGGGGRSEGHTSELQSLMRISSAVF